MPTEQYLHTLNLAKLLNRFNRLAIKVRVPRVISLVDFAFESRRCDLILTGDGLSVENEKGGDTMASPVFKVAFQAPLDTRQATQRCNQRLIGRGVENL